MKTCCGRGQTYNEPKGEIDTTGHWRTIVIPREQRWAGIADCLTMTAAVVDGKPKLRTNTIPTSGQGGLGMTALPLFQSSLYDSSHTGTVRPVTREAGAKYNQDDDCSRPEHSGKKG